METTNDITNYNKSLLSSKIVPNSSYENITDLKIVIGNESATNTIFMDWEILHKGYLQRSIFNSFPYFINNLYIKRKEKFFLTGIKNLRKNVKFLQLSKDLALNLINDQEFEEEIENNPEKFLIDIFPMEDPLDAVLLHEIVNQIGDDFTIDEAGDTFSFDSESIKKHLNELSK